MQVEVHPDAAAASARAAELLAESLVAAIGARGHATVALSGGHTPVAMLEMLASSPVAWREVGIFQVDERLVDIDDDRSNMKALQAAFAAAGVLDANLHAMAAHADSGTEAAARYALALRDAAGAPPVLDVVHLGLGTDGHTASLFPGDAVLGAPGDVALSGPHAGLQRMTLTLATLDRARRRVWLVTGEAKRDIVSRLLRADPALVASRVSRREAFLVLDRAAGESS